MKRADYNEFLYIRSTIRKDQKNGTRPIMGTFAPITARS